MFLHHTVFNDNKLNILALYSTLLYPLSSVRIMQFPKTSETHFEYERNNSSNNNSGMSSIRKSTISWRSLDIIHSLLHLLKKWSNMDIFQLIDENIPYEEIPERYLCPFKPILTSLRRHITRHEFDLFMRLSLLRHRLM